MWRQRLCKCLAGAMLLVVMFTFTACSLFTDDLDAKYSAKVKVASAADSDIFVSRQDVYFAYLEWGYQYASQMEEKELLAYLAEYVLNNKILACLSLDKFGPLTDSEQALARKNAYQALDNSWREYVYEIMGIDDPDQATNDTTTDDTKYQPYHKSILVERDVHDPDLGRTNVYTLDLTNYEDPNGPDNLADYQTYTPVVPGVATDKVANQALSKIVRNLKNTEKGFTKLKKPAVNYLDPQNSYLNNLTKDETAILNREIARLIERNETSIAVARWNVAYDLGFISLRGEAAQQAWHAYLNRSDDFAAWAQTVNATTGQSIASSRAQDVVAYYLDQVRNAIKSYDFNTSETQEKDIVSGGLEKLYYVPYDIAQNLFTVSHILIGFTDEQQAQYEKITNEAQKNPSYDPQADLNKLYAATQKDGKSVYDIYNEIKSTLDDITSLNKKYTTFRDFIDQYNTDPGMQNPSYEYLMSTNAENTTMVEEFTAASIALKNNEDGRGGKGAISGIVWSKFGAHIIMYTRDINELVWTLDETLLDLHYGDILFATLTAYGNKTKFDTLAEYFGRSYSNYQAHLLADFKNEHEITMVESELKNFF